VANGAPHSSWSASCKQATRPGSIPAVGDDQGGGAWGTASTTLVQINEPGSQPYFQSVLTGIYLCYMYTSYVGWREGVTALCVRCCSVCFTRSRRTAMS
jgi:hypothetical protein